MNIIGLKEERCLVTASHGAIKKAKKWNRQHVLENLSATIF